MIKTTFYKETKTKFTEILIFSDAKSAKKVFNAQKTDTKTNIYEQISANANSFGIAVTNEDNNEQQLEKLRKAASQLFYKCNHLGEEDILVTFEKSINKSQKIAVLESLMLTSYQFLQLKSKPEELQYKIKHIFIKKDELKKEELDEINHLCHAVCNARDLVNWPQRNQKATDLAASFISLSKESGFSIDVLNDTKIASLKMGGLLAVNQGSEYPATFSIMEWKPKKAKNKKPIVLIGKGIVYDTGGLSLKSMPGMLTMKCDMHGAATVAGLMYAIAKNNLPIHIVGLVPATDNWISRNSYAPGDVITMFDGTTVEILNTDAEGRLVLADALHYAKKYKPEMVFDFATLTGAAVRAIGTYGTAMMGKVPENIFTELKEAGSQTYERLVELPLWPEYREELKSEIADMSNLGKGDAGAQSAGQFLAHFTNYPWVHFDIAGPSFNDKNHDYNPAGGTGVGIRMLYQFLKTHYQL